MLQIELLFINYVSFFFMTQGIGMNNGIDIETIIYAGDYTDRLGVVSNRFIVKHAD